MFYVYYISTIFKEVYTLQFNTLEKAQKYFETLSDTKYDTTILAHDIKILEIK